MPEQLKTVFLGALLIVHSAQVQAGNLLPNLYMGLECESVNVGRIESDFEGFSAENNFRSVNRSRFVRENGGRTPFSTQIVALKHNQMMLLEKVGYYNNRYAFIVTVRSPEDNDSDFYERVSAFVNEKRYFNIIEQRFSSSPNISAAPFDDFYRLYSKWFERDTQYESR